MEIELTAEQLRALLDYEPETGVFTWKVRPKKNLAAGSAAGHLMKDHGYVVIKVAGKLYRAHRLAWLHVHGKWPDGVIDHINGVGRDNRIANLRDTSRSGNAQNQTRAHKGSRTGVLGVEPQGKKFRAQLKHAGKLIRLGTFETTELAHAAYVAAKRELHPTCTL